MVTPECARGGRSLHWDQQRLLTILEVRRAQSYPDHEVLTGGPVLQWKIVGNSVARTVALALGLSLREAWLKSPIDSQLSRALPKADSQAKTPLAPQQRFAKSRYLPKSHQMVYNIKAASDGKVGNMKATNSVSSGDSKISDRHYQDFHELHAAKSPIAEGNNEHVNTTANHSSVIQGVCTESKQTCPSLEKSYLDRHARPVQHRPVRTVYLEPGSYTTYNTTSTASSNTPVTTPSPLVPSVYKQLALNRPRQRYPKKAKPQRVRHNVHVTSFQPSFKAQPKLSRTRIRSPLPSQKREIIEISSDSECNTDDDAQSSAMECDSQGPTVAVAVVVPNASVIENRHLYVPVDNSEFEVYRKTKALLRR